MKVAADMNLGEVSHKLDLAHRDVRRWGRGGSLVSKDIRPDANYLHMQI